MPGAGGQQPQQRTTFRPPWVKDGPTPLPMPSAPWALSNRRDSKPTTEDAPAFTKVTLKSVAKPAETSGEKEPRKSKVTINPSQSRNEKQASQPSSRFKSRENGRPEPTSRPQLERQVRVEKSRSRGDALPLSKSESTTGAPTLSKSSSRAAIPPPPPPRPPPPPPGRTILKDLPPLSEKQSQKIEMLRSRPRKRPDWACMMKELEQGRKLRHVQCNDRSAPLIERVNKVTADPAGQSKFVFDSEKSNVHNELLQQIQQGISLKSVKTNDRSKPMLDGLKKFRRQMTIEEQIQKAEEAKIDEVIPDEMDDIDAVRDDLQSTKQMLALELRNKEALERDNKRLQARILNLEAELEREKLKKNVQEVKQQDAKMTESLMREAEQARKDAERLENDYSKVADERDKLRGELDEMKRLYSNLDRRMKAGMALAGCPSAKEVARIATQKSVERAPVQESESEEEEEETESSDEEIDPKLAEERRQLREIKLLKNKIHTFQNKEVNARKERFALKEQIKQQQKLYKEENKKFKQLQKEVDKMAKLMADTDEEEEEEEEEEVEEEETESEESDSEESSSEEESTVDDESAPLEKRKNNLTEQVKRHEGRVSSLKKGNYLLKTQVDRLKDDLIKQREKSLLLQEDLDSVLAELG